MKLDYTTKTTTWRTATELFFDGAAIPLMPTTIANGGDDEALLVQRNINARRRGRASI